MAELVHSQIFGKDTKPTIYYIVGFRMKIRQFRAHVWLLKLAGFRIMAFDIDPLVLLGGDPELLGKVLTEFMEAVQADSATHKVAGAYGISLGSFFALNALTLAGVPRAFLNTGGGSIVQAVWEMPVLEPVKKGFEDHGYNRKDLERAWNPIDISQNLNRISGKEIIGNASYADEYIPIKDVLKIAEEWPKQGLKARIFLHKNLSHRGLVIRTLLKIRTTLQFFR